jgi:hypothetical protein
LERISLDRLSGQSKTNVSRSGLLSARRVLERILLRYRASPERVFSECTASPEFPNAPFRSYWRALGRKAGNVLALDYAISVRSTGADKEEVGTVESKSHLHGPGRYDGRHED